MTFARRVFTFAGLYGLVVTAPLYFAEDWIGQTMPPAITHPEYFYGFVGVVLAWQVAFLFIGRDPARYRPLMLVAMLEKFPFVVAALVLYAGGRLPTQILGSAMVDLVLGVLFVVAYVRTGGAGSAS